MATVGANGGLNCTIAVTPPSNPPTGPPLPGKGVPAPALSWPAYARVLNERGPAKVGVRGKNFNRAEEEQLCRSVLYVLQDRIVGSQQRAGVF